MEKKGFFKMNKVTLLLLAVILILDIIMFTPYFFYGHTDAGTTKQFVIVNIVLVAAPTCALIDGYIKTRREEREKGKNK